MRRVISLVLTDTHLAESNIETNKSIYRQAIAIAQQHGLKEIDHAGDVFHSRKAQPQGLLKAFCDILDELADAGIKLNCVVGNHDKSFYSDSDSFLDPFQYHPAIQLYRFCGARFIDKKVGIHYASFFADEQYIAMMQDKDINGGFSSKNILITHIGCQGAVMNNGTKVESRITTDLFHKYDKVLIGHYHDLQALNEKVEYIGASLQHNFGEGTQKGLTLIYDDLSTELVPLEFPKYLKYEVNVKELTTADIEELKKEKELSGDNLRLILKGEEQDLKAFNLQTIRELGISVQLEQKSVDKKELEQRVEPFTSKTLEDEFKVFCKKQKLNHKDGLKYFNKITNINVQTEIVSN